MIDSLVLVSQSYLHYATPEMLRRLATTVRVTLVLPGDEPVNRVLAPHVHEVRRVTAHTRNTLQPAVDPDELAVVVAERIRTNGGDPAAVALFCQHEDNVLPTAQVRERFGIPGDTPEMIRRFRDKLLMKEAVRQHLPGLVPRHRPWDPDRAVEDPAGYFAELVGGLGTERLIVKPTTGAGSVNVAVVSSAADLRTVAEQIRADPHDFVYEVDEMLDGTMYQCDSFVRDGKVVFSGILELGCSNFDFVQGRPLSVHPVVDEDLYQCLFAYNQEVTTALGFKNGSTHNELFLTRDPAGRPVPRFLEIAARVPGGLGVPFHQRNSEINLIDANLLVALGDPAVERITPRMHNNVVSALLPVGHGTVVARNEPPVTSDYAIDWKVDVGDVVDSRSLVDNAGVLTVWNDDPGVLRRDFDALAGYVPLTTR